MSIVLQLQYGLLMFMIYGTGTVIYKTNGFCVSSIDRLCIYKTWKRNFWSKS